jgi:hypothetical protein
MQDGCYAHYISDPLDPELLVGSSQLGDYMRIRQELAPPSKWKAFSGIGSVSSSPEVQTRSQTLAASAPVSTHSQPSTPIPNADLLDNAFPATIMAWLQVCRMCISISYSLIA